MHVYVFGIVHFTGLIKEYIDLKGRKWTTLKNKRETSIDNALHVLFEE